VVARTLVTLARTAIYPALVTKAQPGPVGVVESTISLDVLRQRSVYWKQPLLRKRSVAEFRGELEGGSL
jgi:hypothetical protein